MKQKKSQPKLKNYRFILLLVGIPVAVGSFMAFVPIIDEFETFHCVTTPCEVPKITIDEHLKREFFSNEATNFEECVAQGNAVKESFPRQCTDKSGKNHIEQTACITIHDPVCGVDGKTYSNSCFATNAGVEIQHQGEC